jgi:DNA/RNA endonuclease YhcR with UshA esterase domain
MVLPNLSGQFNKGTLLLVLLLAVMGLQVFQIWKGNQPASPLSAVPLASSTPVEIFSSQTATIRGRITSINGQKMVIENDQKVSGEFSAGRVVLVNEATNLTVASSSADLQKIQLNKEAVINLLYVEGRYVVTSLTYR